MAERKEYFEELDAEIAREDREAAEPKVAGDPTTELRERLDREARARELVATGQFPRYPEGWMIRQQDKRRRRVEREQRERQEREAKLGIPEAQAAWAERVQEINTARNQVIREAQERCRADEQAARERAETELDELGERPTLSDYEVKV